MTDNIKDLFKDEEYCREELKRIREAFGDKRTTEKMWRSIDDTLSLMFFHCPEKLRTIVESFLFESKNRQMYLVTRSL